mmetsp:Transcript_16117/g.28983  ORF Transcript_16117/g.28983 Transcript_16117/m.28983 type:complete len:235 (+) Transcript_16117:2195-2899(+)
MAEQVPKKAGGFLRIERPHRRQRPHNIQAAELLDWNDFELAAETVCIKRHGVPGGDTQRLVFDSAEVFHSQCLQVVQGFLAQNAQLHDVGRIVRLVELDQLRAGVDAFSLGAISEGGQVACAEFAERMGRVRGCFEKLEGSPGVVEDVLGVFRMDGLHLTVCGALREERLCEESCEQLKDLLQLVRDDVEIVVGVLGRCEGVRSASMLADELRILVFVGVRLGAHEEHVLQKMR